MIYLFSDVHLCILKDVVGFKIVLRQKGVSYCQVKVPTGSSEKEINFLKERSQFQFQCISRNFVIRPKKSTILSLEVNISMEHRNFNIFLGYNFRHTNEQ